MRINTTTLLLTCAVLLGSAFTAIAQPTFTPINVVHDCGGAPGNGSFVVNVTSATGDVQIIVSSGGFLFDTGKVTPSGFPYQVTIPNLSGAVGGGNRNYIILVSDDVDSDTKSQTISNFSVTLTSVTHNTNPGCGTPNGAIDVTLTGSSGAGAIHYLWTGPSGALPDVQDLTGLTGGDYNLSYTDGVTTCSIATVHINDPVPTPFSINALSAICEGNGLLVDVFTPTSGYTYSVMEGPSVLASVPYVAGALQITVPAAAMTVGNHSLRVRASAGVCPPRFNDPPDLLVTVHAEPVGHNSTATVCGNQPVGITLTTDPTPVPAATYDIAVDPNGLTLAAGTPSAGTGKLANEIADDVWANTGLGSVVVTYTITPVSAAPASCPGDPFTVMVTVNPQPLGTNSTLTRCSDILVAVNLSTSGTSVAAATYNITTANGGLTQVAGTVSAGIGKLANELADDAWRNTGSTSADVVYTVRPVSAAGCIGDPFTVTVTVNPEPVGVSSTITLCSDVAVGVTLTTDAASVAAANYTIGVNANGLTQSGGTSSAGASKAANEIADDVWRNTGLLPVDVTYTVTPVSAAVCSGDPFTIVVTVNPEPVGSNSTAAKCNDEVSGINLTTSGASVAAANYTIAVNSNGLTQVAGTDSNGPGRAATEIADDAWRNLSNAAVDVVYTITPVSSANCAGNDFTVTVTINPEPVGVAQAVTVCSDALVNVTLGVTAGSVAAATYNITVNANGLAFNGTSPSGGNGKLANELMDDRWINPGLTPVNVEYSIIPVAATLCQGDPFIVMVTIDPGPVGVPDAATRCSDDLLNLMPTTTGTSVAAATYNISINANGLTFSGTTPSAGPGKLSDELLDDAWTNTGTLPVNVIYTITPVSAASCGGDPFTVTVTVNPEPVGVNSSVTVCSDLAVGFTLTTNGSSVAAGTYDIAVNANGLTLSGGTASAGTGKAANELVDDVWTNQGLFPVNVEYTIIPVSAAGCGGNPFVVTVTVRPEPVGVNVADSRCHEEVVGINLTTDAASVSAATYDIIVNSNGLTQVGGTDSNGAGKLANEIAADVWSNPGNVPVNVVYTIIPRTSAGCFGDPFTVTVTINPEPVGVPQTPSVCSDVPVNVTLGVTGGSVAAATYDISVNANGLTFNGTTPSAGTGKLADELIDDRWTNTGGSSVDVVYTIIPVSATLCQGNSFTVTVSVFPAATAEAGGNQALCTDHGVYTLAGAGIGGVASTGTWSIDAEPTPGHATLTPGALADPATATFEASVPGDYVLRLTTDPVPVCGAASDIVTITVMAKPAIAPLPETICANDPTGYEIVMTSPAIPPTTLLAWPAPTASDGSTQGSAGVALLGPPGTIHINDILTNAGAADITVTYVVTPVTGLCVGLPQSIVITVRPAPVVAFGQTKTICSGDFVNYEILLSPLNTPAGTSFSWPDPDLAAGPATSGLDVAPALPGTPHITDRLFNGTAAQLPMVYQVIAKGSNGCTGITRNVTILVDPGAVVEAGSAQAICSNGTATLTGSSIGGLATNGTWTVINSPTPDLGVITGGNATTTPATATFTASIPGDYTLQLETDDPGACSPVADVMVITVRAPGDPSCTGGTGTCGSVSVVPRILNHATCSNSDGSMIFDILPAIPITGDVKITIDGTGSTILPSPRTNFALVDGFQFDDLAVGTYSYSVEYGSAACIKAGFFSIDRSGTIGTPVASNLIDPVCFEGTGTATIDAVNQTGNTLEWSVDGVAWTSFIGGTPVAGLPAGSNLIFVRRSGDPCAGGVMVNLADPAEITATLTPADATCFNNDGTITVANLTGGTAPYTFELNGVVRNLPASNIFGGLTANTYNIIATDSKGCIRTFNPVLISFPGFVAHTVPVTTVPDCIGGGANGKVEFNITDPGSFQFAITTDAAIEPTTYNPLGGTLVSIPNLANGNYSVWIRPMGAGTKCSTKVSVTISGVYTVAYTATASDVVCFAQPTSIVLNGIKGAPAMPFTYTLTNTSDNSVITGTISASQALSAFSINNINRGSYSILLTQDQSAVVPACTTPINGGAIALVIDGPRASLDSLYVKRAISFPDLPSGSALVGVSPSGLEPYETRLELTTPLFAAQEFASDWTAVSLNPQNLKFERSYTNLYSGVYTLGIRDAGGCERTYVFTLNVDTNLFIPNVFTPNGDGHNEVFFIRNLPADTKLLVTNRWGKQVYKSSAYANDWNGGDTVDGMYYYTLTLGSQNYTGWVEIMRGQ